MAAKKNMSVEEVLAACRQADGDGAAAAVPADTPVPVEESAVASEAVEADAAPSSAASAKKASEMSMAEILAAARGEKSAPKPAAAKPAAAKPAAAKSAAAGKASAKASVPAKSQAPKDTMSILAAARKSAKPGPMSKAEAKKQQEKSQTKESGRGKPKIPVPPMPEKPAYVVPPSSVLVPSDETRRGFFSSVATTFMGSFLAVGFTSLGLTHVLWLLGFARFMFPNILIEPPSAFRVGFFRRFCSWSGRN